MKHIMMIIRTVAVESMNMFNVLYWFWHSFKVNFTLSVLCVFCANKVLLKRTRIQLCASAICLIGLLILLLLAFTGCRGYLFAFLLYEVVKRLNAFLFFWQTIFRHVASSPILINIIPYFKKLRKYACKRKTCRLHLAWQIFYAHRRIIMYPSYVHTYRQWEESSFEFKG